MVETTQTTNTSSTTTFNEYCVYRLPCGFCRLMCSPCMKQQTLTVTPTWSFDEIMCNGLTSERKDK